MNITSKYQQVQGQQPINLQNRYISLQSNLSQQNQQQQQPQSANDLFLQHQRQQQINDSSIINNPLYQQQQLQQSQSQNQNQQLVISPNLYQLNSNINTPTNAQLLQQLQQQQQQQQQQQTPNSAINQNNPMANQLNNQLNGQLNGHDDITTTNNINQYSIQLEPSLAQSSYWQQQLSLVSQSRKSIAPHIYANTSLSNAITSSDMFRMINPSSLVDLTRDILDKQAEIEFTLKKQQSSNNNTTFVKSSHSLDDEEIVEKQRRMTSKKQPIDPNQSWFSLDFSGQGIYNLSATFFTNYNFLTKLFLNNNFLKSIPKEISNLKCLRVLDLSKNQLTSLPKELGLLFELRFLYLFDNKLTTLPAEFGNFYELEFLGVEGNPMDMGLVKILAEEGTKELIVYLRDKVLVLDPPAKRKWVKLNNDGEIAEEEDYDGEKEILPNMSKEDQDYENEFFSVLSYNTLCQHYATSSRYKYTPSWALDWDYRLEYLKKEILNLNSDIVCLQEVETNTFELFWVPLMEKHGYKSYFSCKTRFKTMAPASAKKVDGCAIFYKTRKFQLLDKSTIEFTSFVMSHNNFKKTDDIFNRFMNKDNVAIVVYLQHKFTGNNLILSNTHLHWDPNYNDVKAMQITALLDELQRSVKKYTNLSSKEAMNKTPIVICGDFNSQTNSAVYQLLSSGTVNKHKDLEGRDYGTFTNEGFTQPFNLRSTYDTIGELPFTNHSAGFIDVIDYIWYSTQTLNVKGLLGKIDEKYLENVIGLPNAHFPSDHIPLVAKYSFKKNLRNSSINSGNSGFNRSRKT
ncbi:CCR4-NOT core exoribonuclease subunit CCR4 ASCRUDRAFT_33819 [Ascoidea rubescens DSM 1968]|uniref:CCR4-Not complex 3'-5'-exoribonuclease subunit Ccr4 n=1 Tax=Ascoidea rubescens DSM 1968 TaxID=1344418 RepID=A0A1D2VJ14_9ASCO|nr:hypothetical protein ASCRUDRAFT_33819 [Ascoidea rubescens DSM 1968]ODV61618.1 hypothetical protein ASCRUDRAFT_33819 [Ascoidea rubescens DSM 1968]